MIDKIYKRFSEDILSGKIKVDTGGHLDDAFKDEGHLGYLLHEMHTAIFTQVFGLKKSDYLSIPLLNPRNRREIYLTNFLRCDKCNEYIDLYKRGNRIYTKSAACIYADGVPEQKVRINVPSGKLLLYNDLRWCFPGVDRLENNNYRRFDVNSLQGEFNLSREYAKHGMIHVFVGNSCPGIYQQKDTRLVVGCGHEDETIPGKKIGDICTDLWWFCGVDHDLFVKKGGMSVRQFDKRQAESGLWTRMNVARVKPGRYEASIRHHLTRIDDDNQVFSVIRRVGPC